MAAAEILLILKCNFGRLTAKIVSNESVLQLTHCVVPSSYGLSL